MELKEELKSVFVSKILKKRHKEQGKESDDKHFIIYDLEKFEIFKDLTIKNNSNPSSAICNMIDYVLESVDSPQRTMEVFAFQKKAPTLDADPLLWKKYFASLDREEYGEIDKFLNTVLYLHNQRGREF